jgi:hypothetical protein
VAQPQHQTHQHKAEHLLLILLKVAIHLHKVVIHHKVEVKIQ